MNWVKAGYRIMQALICVAMLIVITGPAAADIPGHDDPDFSAALAHWLQGDDLNALRQMAILANADNTAAQVMLALIDKTAALPGPDLIALPRAERIALMRQPGGLSGQSWIYAAADSHDIPRTWIALWKLEGGTELARDFASYAEPRATREALLTLVSRSESGFPAPVRGQDWYPASLAYLTEDRIVTPADLRHLPPYHPLQGMVGTAQTDAQLQRWLNEDDLALPLREACDSQCPATRDLCARALFQALDGYTALLLMGSPVASLIPDAEFAASPRGVQSVARRIMLRHSARGRSAVLRQVGDLDRCTADWLDTEFRRYTYTKRAPVPVPAD